VEEFNRKIDKQLRKEGRPCNWWLLLLIWSLELDISNMNILFGILSLQLQQCISIKSEIYISVEHVKHFFSYLIIKLLFIIYCILNLKEKAHLIKKYTPEMK